MKEAYFAGGCFWCITPVFRDQNGVENVVCGFSGGQEVNPSYEDVKYGKTHHRETLQITYDPAVISYDTLLNIFLWNTDPFDGEGQFIDRGPSYTLALFYSDASEKALIEEKLNALQQESGREPKVAVCPFLSFYPAPEEHQNFDWKEPKRFLAELEESGRNEFFRNR